MKISAVLITKDKEYPPEILGSLIGFDEVIIETKCPRLSKRYELAMQAKNDVIYVQDDDCIVDAKSLIAAYNGQITNFMTPEHYESYNGTGVTLIGWGALFSKEMIDFTPYFDVFGVNPLFLSQADRVFTYLNQPHNSIVTRVNHLPRAYDETRMSTQPDHWENLRLIQEQLKNLQN